MSQAAGATPAPTRTLQGAEAGWGRTGPVRLLALLLFPSPPVLWRPLHPAWGSRPSHKCLRGACAEAGSAGAPGEAAASVKSPGTGGCVRGH